MAETDNMTSPGSSESAGPARGQAADAEGWSTFALWLAPRRLRRYAIMKALGAAGFAAIFAGWMLIQWSNLAMRLAAAGLLTTTLVVTVRTIAADRRRAHGRQVAVMGDEGGPRRLKITTPDAAADLPLEALAAGRWREDAGLDLLDAAGRTLATLDRGLVEDEHEARAFLGWLRAHSGLALRVKWTDERPGEGSAPER